MTALEYMEKQLDKNRLNYERESARGVPEEMLHSIRMKISYYQEAVNALNVVRCKNCRYWQDNNGGYPHDECRWGKDETPDADDFCSYGERRENNAVD